MTSTSEAVRNGGVVCYGMLAARPYAAADGATVRQTSSSKRVNTLYSSIISEFSSMFSKNEWHAPLSPHTEQAVHSHHHQFILSTTSLHRTVQKGDTTQRLITWSRGVPLGMGRRRLRRRRFAFQKVQSRDRDEIWSPKG